jgi:hypothetical protein
MILSYKDFFTGEVKEIKAKITTDHSASSYGQPVIIHPDGSPLELSDWVLLQYRVISADKSESELLQKFYQQLNTNLSMLVNQNKE